MTARAELGTLEAGGLIEIAALQPELEYLFRHAMVQEAAYATLLKQDRRALHLAAAETILSLHPDRERELAGVIGMHLELGGDASRAADYLLIAGEHALERFANKEAVAFFTRAFALADDSRVNLRLRAAIGSAMAGWTFNAPGTDIDRLEQALAGAGDVDQRLVAEGNFWAAFLRRQRGEVPETSPQLKVALQRGAESSQTLKDPTVAALPKAFVGAFSALTGNLREGARQMREVFDTIEATADPVSAAMVANFLAFSYARLGDFAAAEEINARSERLAGIGDAIALVDAEIARAAIDLERGEPKKATEHALRCAARAEDLGAYACVLASNVIAGAATLALDDAAAARRPVERGNELGHVTNMAPMRNLVQGFLGSVRAQLGDLPGGIAAWDEALANARAMNDRYGEAHTLWGRARTIGRQADPDWTAALADIDRAVELFEDMEARPALARVHHDRAEVLRALGRVDEAAEVDRQSRELGRELGLRDAAFA